MRGVKAEGGWAVVSTEEAEIHPTSDISPSIEQRIWDEHDLPGLRLMTEAVRAAIDHLFAVTNAEAIRSGLFDYNDASGAVQRKLGFVEVGRSTRFNLARGAEFGHIDTELSRAAWMGDR